MTDTEPVMLEHLDFVPECDIRACEKEAEWEIALTCGCTGVMCHRHYLRCFEKGRTRCGRCGSEDVFVARGVRL